ncbi:hypothetical protein B9Z55_006286 [Caenorhabditis nigoni]|uniref:Uncharacterized protein n=1 Tax=Caenorhabditis nigoni TaxID=1611254 RepID=A0A2G5V4F5_9PELO|nr:hypothetical protein B9Z55_006286 [Caenorhabditis nigoni]
MKSVCEIKKFLNRALHSDSFMIFDGSTENCENHSFSTISEPKSNIEPVKVIKMLTEPKSYVKSYHRVIRQDPFTVYSAKDTPGRFKINFP